MHVAHMGHGRTIGRGTFGSLVSSYGCRPRKVKITIKRRITSELTERPNINGATGRHSIPEIQS